MVIDSVAVGDPLEVVAGKIRALWKKSEDQRLAAALLLKEAKERVEAGEDPHLVSFASWCHAYLPERSKREIRKLLQIASAPDPKAALDKMRSDTREQTRRWRERAASREATFRDETTCGPSGCAANDAVWDWEPNGDPSKGGEEVDTGVEIDNSIAGTETGEHTRRHH